MVFSVIIENITLNRGEKQMFTDIEKEYKKMSKERHFNIYYWCSALFISLIAVVISKVFNDFDNFKYYFIYISFFILILIYFYIDFINTIKSLKIKKKEKLINKFKLYIIQNKNNHINNLLKILTKHNFRTKNDLKLAIDYYNRKQPIQVESSFLAWIVSTALTLSSFVEIAYDSETKSIDYQKISIILRSTIGYIIAFLIPIIIFKIFINSIILPKKKIYSQLSEDLSYIYLNFNKYVNQLTK